MIYIYTRTYHKLVFCVVSTGVRVMLRLQLLQPGGSCQPHHGAAAVQLPGCQHVAGKDAAAWPPGCAGLCLDCCSVVRFLSPVVDVAFVDVVMTIAQRLAGPNAGDTVLPPRPCLGLSQNIATSRNTKAWAVSEQIDTSKNTKAWAVSQHIDTIMNTEATLKCCYTALSSYVGITFSTISSLRSSSHPPEMEIWYPPKTACGCPCGGGKDKRSHTQSFHPVKCVCQCTVASMLGDPQNV